MALEKTTLSDFSESKWLKELIKGLVYQTLIERSPWDSIIDSKRLVTGTI